MSIYFLTFIFRHNYLPDQAIDLDPEQDLDTVLDQNTDQGTDLDQDQDQDTDKDLYADPDLDDFLFLLFIMFIVLIYNNVHIQIPKYLVQNFLP